MSGTVTFTQAQLDALVAAYASGVLTYEYDGKRITYHSRKEMKAIIDDITTKLRGTRRQRVALASFNRR
jgi:hypothetical protein